MVSRINETESLSNGGHAIGSFSWITPLATGSIQRCECAQSGCNVAAANVTRPRKSE